MYYKNLQLLNKSKTSVTTVVLAVSRDIGVSSYQAGEKEMKIPSAHIYVPDMADDDVPCHICAAVQYDVFSRFSMTLAY